MQTRITHIYKELAQENGKSEQLYRDLGNFIWKETHFLINNPPSLIINLKGVGKWHLRKKKIMDDMHVLDDKTKLLFTSRLEDYEKYIALRNDIRQQRRNEDTILPETTDGEDQG